MTALWLPSDIQALFPQAPHFGTSITGVSIDTRTLKPGDLFVALQGEQTDGHRFIEQAFHQGAAAAFVHQERLSDLGTHHFPLIPVPDTLKALETLAQAARQRFQGRVIGITGSAGKTSVKDALSWALGQQGTVHASLKSYNNHYGVPLTLAQMPPNILWAVLEMGMNHTGELRHLTSMARPHVAIITTVAPAHLAFFPSEEAIADAKAEIFFSMDAESSALLPLENPHFERLNAHAHQARLGVVTFGHSPQADCRLKHHTVTPQGTHVQAAVLGHDVDYTLPTPGIHRVLNSLAILGGIALVGGNVTQASHALAHIPPSSGRGALHKVSYKGRQIRVVDESYNANPASMTESLKALACYTLLSPQGRRIALLGDMRELGETSPALHAQLAQLLTSLPIHHVLTCGPHMAALHHALAPEQRGPHRDTSADLIPLLDPLLCDGDIVMIKGSFSMHMRVLVEELLSESSAPASH